MEIVTKKRVADLNQFAMDAHEAPWKLQSDGMTIRKDERLVSVRGHRIIPPVTHGFGNENVSNLELIVEMRNSLPLLLSTIEQFAEALRGECECYVLRSWEGNHAMCNWCRHRKALLAQYDGATGGGGDGEG